MFDPWSVSPLQKRDSGLVSPAVLLHRFRSSRGSLLTSIVDPLRGNFQPPFTMPFHVHSGTFQSHNLMSAKGCLQFANSKWIGAERVASQGMGQLMAKALPEKGSKKRARRIPTHEHPLGH